MTTYGLTLGMRARSGPARADPSSRHRADLADAGVEPHPTMIDDLWHATINGRGQMYLRHDATETAPPSRPA
jgi:type IV pilus assembly protein PilY1